MVTILIADDHAIVREGLKQIIVEQKDMLIGGEAQNGGEVMSLLPTKKWDVVVLDISMPGRNGLEVLKDIKQLFPKLPVLMLSMHPEDQYALRALRAGAAGYITKESAPNELVTAIRKIVGGGRYITEAVAETVIDAMNSGDDRLPHQLLSDREFQVLCLIGSGKTMSEIAKELSLSVKTISTYRSRILEKMKLRTNAELTQYVISRKLLP